MSGRNWLRTLLADSTILFPIWGETLTEYLRPDRQGRFVTAPELQSDEVNQNNQYLLTWDLSKTIQII